MSRKRIGIKVGSALLAAISITSNYMINKAFIKALMRQISDLINQDFEVFLVSSGAVASDYHLSRSKELRAAVGQPNLMATYRSYLGNHCHPVREAAQFLLIKEDMAIYHDHIREVINEAMENKVLPVINANDPVSSNELNRLEEFEDNDRLFEAVCRMLRPDYAVIATDVDGVMDDAQNVIHDPDYLNDMIEVIKFFDGDKDRHYGTGGMGSKIEVAKNLSASGIKSIIVNGHEPRFIIRAIGQLDCGRSLGYKFGTVVIPNFYNKMKGTDNE